ncbi:hypothetical protein K438DRAFT_1770522, partial [Mycena galopus ATCC 62051]
EWVPIVDLGVVVKNRHTEPAHYLLLKPKSCGSVGPLQALPGLNHTSEQLPDMSRPGRRYEGIPVMVFHGTHKGLQGVVLADYDSAERFKRLNGGAQAAAIADQDGILVTIGKEMSQIRIENIPIDTRRILTEARYLPNDVLFGRGSSHNVDMQPYNGIFPVAMKQSKARTPPLAVLAPMWTVDALPPLDGEYSSGEDTGQWLALPQLAHKRIDVQVVGVNKLRRPSATMLALEGKFGRLLIDNPIPPDKSKVNVYAVGKNGLKHAIDRTCIKPRRQGDGGESLWEMTARVVILGPDVHEKSSHIGEYGQTMPSVRHPYGRGVVPIQFLGEDDYNYYYETMLSSAKNEKGTTLTQIRPVNDFRVLHYIGTAGLSGLQTRWPYTELSWSACDVDALRRRLSKRVYCSDETVCRPVVMPSWYHSPPALSITVQVKCTLLSEWNKTDGIAMISVPNVNAYAIRMGSL